MHTSAFNIIFLPISYSIVHDAEVAQINIVFRHYIQCFLSACYHTSVFCFQLRLPSRRI